MNRDPLGEEGGINFYGFIQNDLVNWIDPLGLTGEAVIPINPGPGGYTPVPSIPHGGTGSGNGGSGISAGDAIPPLIGGAVKKV
jgi:hypothetical protein